jgi:hypothetical protein
LRKFAKDAFKIDFLKFIPWDIFTSLELRLRTKFFRLRPRRNPESNQRFTPRKSKMSEIAYRLVFPGTFPGYSKYIIHSNGTVWSETQKRFLRPTSRGGYKFVKLSDDNNVTRSFSVHRLVASVFLENPDNLSHVNHIDEDGYNNVKSNLEWTNNRDNVLHSLRLHPERTTTRAVLQLTMGGELVAKHPSLIEAAKAIGSRHDIIGAICNNNDGRRKSAKGFKWEFETPTLREMDTEDGEIWGQHPAHTNYMISSFGKVYSNITKRMKKFTHRKDGYLRVGVENRRQRYVHCLVAETFLDPPSKDVVQPEVDHVDGDRKNNRLDNLRWLSHAENTKVAVQPNAKAVSQYSVSGEFIATYPNFKNASEQTGINHGAIGRATKSTGKRNVGIKAESITAGGFIWRYGNEPPSKSLLKRVARLYRAEPIHQYTIEGTFIRTWASRGEIIEESGLFQTQTSRQALKNALCGKLKSTAGFIWCHDGDPVPTKTVYARYTLKGKLIDTWTNLRECASQTMGEEKDLTHVAAVCAGKRPTAYGYRWRRCTSLEDVLAALDV